MKKLIVIERRLFLKNSLEIISILAVNPKYVQSLLEKLFLPIKEKTGKMEITEDDFIRTMDHRLGETSVAKRFWKYFSVFTAFILFPNQSSFARLFDKEGKGSVECISFLKTLHFLESGDEKKRLEGNKQYM